MRQVNQRPRINWRRVVCGPDGKFNPTPGMGALPMQTMRPAMLDAGFITVIGSTMNMHALAIGTPVLQRAALGIVVIPSTIATMWNENSVDFLEL